MPDNDGILWEYLRVGAKAHGFERVGEGFGSFMYAIARWPEPCLAVGAKLHRSGVCMHSCWHLLQTRPCAYSECDVYTTPPAVELDCVSPSVSRQLMQ